MRELKFRAWDKVEKKMLFDADPFAIHVSGSNEPLLAETHRNENCIFEQYTGLKDKKGKEIYEGDIIRCHGDDRFIAPVIRHDNSGGFCWVSCYKEECFIPESDEVEVIGNIHENPELLEQDNAKD